MMRQLSYPESLEFNALPRSFREKITNGSVVDNNQIDFKCFTKIDGCKTEYISASKFLEPNISLIFEVKAKTSNRLSFPLKVIFIKTNHGIATPEAERGIEQPSVVKYIHKNKVSQYNRSTPTFIKTEILEATKYRGLHTMKCEIYDADGLLLFRDWIGVMIR